MGATALLLDLAAGIALLLWGVRMVRTGMTRAFGARLRRLLGSATRNRFSAFAAGIGVTALLQSATATAMLVASFAGRRLIGPAAALAVMLGADVGTTLAAQLLSLDLHWMGPLALVIGVGLFLSTESGNRRHVGRLFIGFGLLLLALRLIVAASEPLRNASAFATVMAPLAQEPLLAVALAALLTWAAHSSLAIVLMLVGLASAGAISVPLALALVLGANIGGAVAPFAATAGQTPAARRAPLGNLLMRAIGVVIALPLLSFVPQWLGALGLEGPRLAVHFHTAFNLALALLFLPLLAQVELLCRRLLPDAPTAEDSTKPRYLDSGALDTPSVALAAAARETLRLSDTVSRMLDDAITVFKTDDARLAKAVEQADDQVDKLHEAIKLYLTKLSNHEMDAEESRRYVDVLTFTTNLEHIGDIIDKNLMELAAKKIKHRLHFSPEGMQELADFHARVAGNLQMACNVFMASDAKLARQLLQEKASLREAERMAAENHYRRLAAGRAESIETSAIHLDVIRDLKRINSHLTAVAYPILEQTGELSATRLRADEQQQAGKKAAPNGGHAKPA
ncbi:Na/Pi cotransporter family protein [Ferrovibrio sp.]|uniref:Na/Pi cotransporter family protein n=1 Tax=Ferrovibrio sp. TaxID=1917215 RepID=UPI003D276CE1